MRYLTRPQGQLVEGETLSIPYKFGNGEGWEGPRGGGVEVEVGCACLMRILEYH